MNKLLIIFSISLIPLSAQAMDYEIIGKVQKEESGDTRGFRIAFNANVERLHELLNVKIVRAYKYPHNPTTNKGTINGFKLYEDYTQKLEPSEAMHLFMILSSICGMQEFARLHPEEHKRQESLKNEEREKLANYAASLKRGRLHL